MVQKATDQLLQLSAKAVRAGACGTTSAIAAHDPPRSVRPRRAEQIPPTD